MVKSQQTLKIETANLIKFKIRCLATEQKYSDVVDKLIYNSLNQDKKNE